MSEVVQAVLIVIALFVTAYGTVMLALWLLRAAIVFCLSLIALVGHARRGDLC